MRRGRAAARGLYADIEASRKPAPAKLAHLEIMLPYPPSVNHYWLIAGSRMIISDAGKAYRARVLELALHHRLAGSFGAARLSVALELTMPDNRRRDIDNTAKALLDALTAAGVWTDDEQIDRLLIERKGVTRGGMVRCTIKTLP
jgi:crossover junction endodeoxyribonuclease RusA